ncbi:MAG: Asp-tRNA(Asn)/Glu-tRNA(Gln) amidotransferase subunit GatC [Minicystis sp.]
MDAPATPPITIEEAQKIARLAHLALAPDELERLTRDLAGILGYVRQLEEVDVSDVPPTAHVLAERQPLREDEPGSSLPRELALREAPRVAMDGFAVPAFVDEG